nr:hypothetical protein [Tanacetum cinerariifolium]
MNGWLVEDDDEEEKVDEMNVDNDEDDAEVVHPYEEVNPLNRPPPDSDKEAVFARATAHVTSFTLQPINQGDHRMNGFDFDLSAMDSGLREQILNHSKMVQLVEGLSKQFQDCGKEEVIQAENRKLREMLRSAQARADYYHETSEFYRDCSARVPYDPAANHALRIRPDDPYMIDRDVATTSARDDGDAASRDPQPSEPRGSPRDSHGNTCGNKDQGGAPPVRECTYTGFVKCNFTTFCRNEGAVELCRWFERTKSVFSINERAERNKIKFSAATLQG